jgi:hypothetical protein
LQSGRRSARLVSSGSEKVNSLLSYLADGRFIIIYGMAAERLQGAWRFKTRGEEKAVEDDAVEDDRGG